MARLCYALLLGLFGAALVHIGIILLVPHYTGAALWNELKAEIPAYQFTALPRAGKLAARADPFLRQIFCRFNLADGPVRLSAAGAAPFWSLAVYSAKGEALYSITDSSAPGGAVDVIIIDPAEFMDFKHNLPEAYTDSAYAALNGGRNFAVLRVLVPSADWREETDAFLQTAKCSQIDY